MILNNAPAIYVGGKMAERVYSDGEIVWGLPDGYRRCKYLESSNYTYIATPIIPNSHTGVFVEFTLLQETASDVNFFGARIHGGEKFMINHYQNKFGFGIGSPWITTDIQCKPNVRYSVWLNYMDGKLFTVDDTSVGLEPAISAKLPAVGLFCQNTSQGISNIRKQKVFSLIVSNGTDIVLKFIPAIAPSGKPCMCDTFSKQPFYNQGTGEFGYELMDGTYVAPI